METVTIHDARTNLSRLIARAERGEEIVIARGRQPVARLVPVKKAPKMRQPEMFRGKVEIGPAFFEPLSPEDPAFWE